MARIVRALLPGMLATVAMAVVAPAAHAAGTATITNGTLYFLGTSGSDKVTITNTANPSFSVRIKPVSNDPDGAATGCTLDGTQTLTCGDAAGFRHVEVYTGTGGPGAGAPGGTGAGPAPGARVAATLPRLYISAGSLVFNRFAVSVTRRGAKCPRAVTMRTAFRRTVKGRTLTVRVTRALRPSKKACIITTKVALPSSARRLPALSVSVRGVGVKSRTVRARRIGR